MSDQMPPVPAVPKVPARKVAEGANLAGPVDVPLRHQLFLAIDYGQKRTGVASGNRITHSKIVFFWQTDFYICRYITGIHRQAITQCFQHRNRHSFM
mgnify:CR=1 FL=1